MNYEQRYKEALARAKEYFKANQKIGELDENDVLSGIFPELKDVEFEQEPTSDHWQDVRERAAIAAIQAFCAAPVTKDTESMTIDDATKFAVEIADALVEKLKGE